MHSEDRRIKDIIFHYQLIREREYPGNYFLDIQLVTYFSSSISSIFSLLFPSLQHLLPPLSSFPTCLCFNAMLPSYASLLSFMTYLIFFPPTLGHLQSSLLSARRGEGFDILKRQHIQGLAKTL